jgi:hypothetical protein
LSGDAGLFVTTKNRERYFWCSYYHFNSYLGIKTGERDWERSKDLIGLKWPASPEKTKWISPL